MKKIYYFLLIIAIYVLLMMGPLFLGFLSPHLWVWQPVVAALLAAGPVMYVARRWPRVGGVALLPLIYLVLLVSMGEMNSFVSLAAALLSLALAEIMRFLMGYNTAGGLRAGYAMTSLLPVCQLLPLWQDQAAYHADAVEEMGSAAYADALMLHATPTVLIALVVCTIVAAIAGMILCEKNLA